MAPDLVRVQAGDQLVADGTVERSDGLRLDESVLTGESVAVSRERGDGRGPLLRPPALPAGARDNRLLLGLIGLVLVRGSLLGYALWHRDAGTHEAVATATAGVVSLVPEGLIVLARLTYAVGSVRMSRRGVLAQQLNAIESLASADVICLGKTGTLTEDALRLVDVIPAPGAGRDELSRALGRYAASARALATSRSPPSRTHCRPQAGPWAPRSRSPRGGAGARSSSASWRASERETSAGRRVVALGRTAAALREDASRGGASAGGRGPRRAPAPRRPGDRRVPAPRGRGAQGALRRRAAALLLPPARHFFQLAFPTPGILATAACGGALAILALHLAGYDPGHPPAEEAR